MKKKIFLYLAACLLMPLAAAQTSIADIQGGTASSPLVNQSVSTGGLVTAVYSDGFCIQDDNAPWSGVFVYAPGISPQPRQGDAITLDATVQEYYELTELGSVTNLVIHSSGNDLPTPIVVTTGEATEPYEGVLITIDSAMCTNTDLGFGEWEIDDGSGALAVDDKAVQYSPGLGTPYQVTGPLFYSFDAYKMEPRDPEDIFVKLPIYFSIEPTPSEISTEMLSISWTTNSSGTTELIYGTTRDLELGHLQEPGARSDHLIQLTGLEPGSIYYIQPFSVSGTDTTPTRPYLFATASLSGGEIHVYFNQPVNHGVATSSQAQYTSNITDTLISYIEKAEERLDLALYDFTNHAAESDERNTAIIDAINVAYNRGVKVRFITDDEPDNSVLENLDPGIPLLKGNSAAIMHNKFLVIDPGSASNAWLVTGSTNPNFNNLVMDANNLVCIQDQSIARAYLLEFEEMWGGPTDLPDLQAARFGENKTDNTPHVFMVDDRRVELYFSPSDRTAGKIKSLIDSAQHEVAFAMLAFTENSLGTAVVQAYNRGLDTRGIIDYVEFTGSEFNYLVNQGVPVVDFTGPGGTSWPDGPTLHHKYAIVDYLHPESQPVVITGSHNWTATANSRNDENTLMIYDSTIANQFYQEFYQRYIEQGGIFEAITGPPVAVSDFDTLYAIENDTIEVLQNDELQYPVALEIMDQPSNGVASKTPGYNSIIYLPNTGFAGTDTVKYKICYLADEAMCDTGYLFVTVISSTNVNLQYHRRPLLYPNPANDFVTVAWSDQLKAVSAIEIMDLLGRLRVRIEKPVSFSRDQWTIDTSSLEHGIYLLRLRSDKGESMAKLIIE